MNILDRIPTWGTSADDELFPEPVKAVKPAVSRKPVLVIGYVVQERHGKGWRTTATKARALTLSDATALARTVRRRGGEVRVMRCRDLVDSR